MLKIAQKTPCRLSSGNVLCRSRRKYFDACENEDIEEISKDEAVGIWRFREVIGGLMWLATQTLPGIVSAVRAVTRHCAGPR